MQTLYAKAGGTGDGSTLDKAGDFQALQRKLQPGGKLLVHNGDTLVIPQWPAFSRKNVSGAYIGPVDGTRFTLRTGPGDDAITFMLSDDVTIAGAIIEQLDRDPTAAGYNPNAVPQGTNAVHFMNCQRPKLIDCEIGFHENGVVAESSLGGDAGGILTRVKLHHVFAADNSEQGQGVYLVGQTGWLIEDCDLDTIGWDGKTPAQATMFRHGTYSKNVKPASGPFRAVSCRLRNCASSALTADTGAEYDHCLISSSSNVPVNKAGAGAAQIWAGGPYSHVHHCTVYLSGGLGISLLALAGDVHDNVVFVDPSGTPFHVGLQKGTDIPTARDASMKVNVYNNTAVYRRGVPLPPESSLVAVEIGGPSVVTTPNRVFSL